MKAKSKDVYDFELIGRKLAKLGLSQAELANRTARPGMEPLSQPVICNFLSGRRAVLRSTAKRIIEDGLKLRMSDVVIRREQSA